MSRKIFYSMKNLKVFLVFMINVILVSSEEISSRFVIDYFTFKNIQQIVIFACWDDTERTTFSKQIMLSRIRVTYVDIYNDFDIANVLKLNYYTLGVLLDFDCPESKMIFDKFSAAGLQYNEIYNWLVVTKNDELPLDILKNVQLTIDTEMTVALQREGKCVLYDVYNHGYKHGGRLNVTYMGYWNPLEGVNSVLNQYKYERRRNLHGLMINFSVVAERIPKDMEIHTYLESQTNKFEDAMAKGHYELTKSIRDMFNFTMRIKNGKTWGDLVNGSFTGVMGDLSTGMADVSLSPLRLKKERYIFSEFTVLTHTYRGRIFFRHPKSNEIRNIFLTPFEMEVWYTVCCTGVVYWILLLIISKIEIYFHSRPPTSDLEAIPETESIINTVGVLCLQGTNTVPAFLSGRIVLLSLLVLSFFLSEFYSAIVVASLLKGSPKVINTLKDLVKSNLKIGIQDVGFIDAVMNESAVPGVEDLQRKSDNNSIKRRKAVSYYKNVTLGIQNIQRGGYAYYVNPVEARRQIEDTFSEEQICDLTEIYLHNPIQSGTFVSKQSPFKNMFLYGLRKIVEHGINSRVLNRWQGTIPSCPASYSSKPVPVRIEDFVPAFFLLFIGYITCITITLLEFLIRRIRQRRLKPEQTKSL